MAEMYADESRDKPNANERDAQTFAIIGASFEVHSELGAGFLEAVYQSALAAEFRRRGIPFQREVLLPVTYKGDVLDCAYKADFVCYGEVIVELKALTVMSGTEQSQVLNYLKATGLHRALLINFGTSRVETKRLVL